MYLTFFLRPSWIGISGLSHKFRKGFAGLAVKERGTMCRGHEKERQKRESGKSRARSISTRRAIGVPSWERDKYKDEGEGASGL